MPAEREPKEAPASAAVVLDPPTASAGPGGPARVSEEAKLHEAPPEGTGAPDWSPESLLRVGLPFPLVRPVIEKPPATDAAWIEAVSQIVARFCGPLTKEAQLFAGPRAHLLAEPLRLPQVDYPDTPPATGSAILALDAPTADLGLVVRLLGGRRLHLVAGGRSWERLQPLRPLLVSWVGAEALPAALALCAAHGLVLGYGRAGTGTPTFHATPLDVALALRDLVGRR
jgi:hypothetical protein